MVFMGFTNIFRRKVIIVLKVTPIFNQGLYKNFFFCIKSSYHKIRTRYQHATNTLPIRYQGFCIENDTLPHATNFFYKYIFINILIKNVGSVW